MWGKVALLWAVFLHVTHCVIPRFPGLRLERLGLWSPFGKDKAKKETLAFFRNSAENANLVLKWTDRMFLAPHVFVIALDLWKNPGEAGEYSGFQVRRMVKWLQKSKPQKIPRASNETQENPWTKINPQKIAYRISKPLLKSGHRIKYQKKSSLERRSTVPLCYLNLTGINKFKYDRNNEMK